MRSFFFQKLFINKIDLIMKKTITESQLRNIVAESVKNVLNEMNSELEPLMKMGRSYHPNMDMKPNILDKTFNNGNGSIPFVEIIPDEKVLLVNKSFANKRDLARIQQCFPEYTIEEVSLGYPDWYTHRDLRSMRQK